MPTVIKLRNKTTTAAAECQPCQAARERTLAAAEQTITVDPSRLGEKVTWSGPIIFEGQMTGDGRYIEPNALTWDSLPIPLRWAREDTGEHNGAVVVGRILAIERRPGGVIWGTGDFDTVHADSVEAARQVKEHLSNGVSADLDNVSFEVRVAQELMEAEGIPGEPDQMETDAEGRVTVLDIDADAEVMDIDDARIRAATLVAVPAFSNARIELDANDAPDSPADTEADTGIEVGDHVQWDEPPDEDSEVETHTGVVDSIDGDTATVVEDSTDADDGDTYKVPVADLEPVEADTEENPANSGDSEVDDLVAAGGPVLPPAEWFADPHLDRPTPITITDDGRIFGHAAQWGSCHTAFPKECVSPPRSPSNYSYFRTGAILTASGQEIPVGHITLDTFHASKNLGPADTIAHYEHTGATVADVAAGEDEHGIWVAGAIRPNLSDDQLRTLRSSPLSGDWRRIGGQLELVAALAVNVPGFPVPRAQGLVASSGAVQSLVASGIVLDRAAPAYGRGAAPAVPRTEDEISTEALAWLQQKVEPLHRKEKAAKLRRKVRYDRLTRRVQKI